MKNRENLCFECGKQADQNHHVVPRVHGGTKTVPLCEYHHGLCHDLKFRNHRYLTMQGLKIAKSKGIILGRAPPPPSLCKEILELHRRNLTQRAIASIVKVGKSSVNRIIIKNK